MALWDWVKQLLSGTKPAGPSPAGRGQARPGAAPQVVVNPTPTDFSQMAPQVVTQTSPGFPQPASAAPSRPAAQPAPARPAAQPAQPEATSFAQLDAGAFAPLSDDEIR